MEERHTGRRLPVRLPVGEQDARRVPEVARDRSSHEIALELKEELTALALTEGIVLKTAEPPPRSPPVISAPMVAERGRAAFDPPPHDVDIDDSYGPQAVRRRVGPDPSAVEFHKVQQAGALDALELL